MVSNWGAASGAACEMGAGGCQAVASPRLRWSLSVKGEAVGLPGAAGRCGSPVEGGRLLSSVRLPGTDKRSSSLGLLLAYRGVTALSLMVLL